MRFDFNEANILKQNLFSANDDKKTLLTRLEKLYENTRDPVLKKSTRALIGKLETLSDEEISRIRYDIFKDRFAVTSYYKVIYRK